MFSKDFISGFISATATFYHTQTVKNDQFGFQIKVPVTNYELLKQLCRALGIKNTVHVYKKQAVIHTRSFREIADKIIPFCDDHLYGQKLSQYIKWKQDLLKYYAALEKNA